MIVTSSVPRKSSVIFGYLWKTSEIFEEFSEAFVWPSDNFWRLFGNLRIVLGNLRKIVKKVFISNYVDVVSKIIHTCL